MNIHRLPQLRNAARPWVEFLRTTDLSLGLYRLEAGAGDRQHPHTEAEVYYVVAGRARFAAGEEDVEVSAGDVLCVPANEPHRFHDVLEDLDLLVFFAPAEGSRGSAGSTPPERRPSGRKHTQKANRHGEEHS